MNLPPDDDLRAVFAQQRRCDHDETPAWREELLHAPMQRRRASWRWLPVAFATACIPFAALFFTHTSPPEPKLSEELPPLFDSPPGELFASLEPSFTTFEAPSDFLLPDHLNIHIP
ncbi:MAG: hypothetical protein ACKVY0_10580 [Prosthecobacter sp.]|uniref:hypothetical protein n=1 Tax=Prosthecobacter sp. TaxID=1965333 RepID=UPI0039021C64